MKIYRLSGICNSFLPDVLFDSTKGLEKNQKIQFAGSLLYCLLLWKPKGLNLISCLVIITWMTLMI